MMKKRRIDWIDYEKGFILMFVCLAHCGVYSPINGFHMAAFFFISGMLFNDKYDSIKNYVLRKVHTLLIPYLGLSFLFLFLYRKLYANFFHNFLLYGNDIIQGYSSPNVSPLWFVYSLFQVTCAFFILFHFTKRKVRSKLWILLLACICFGAGWILNKHILPFKISTFITSLAFYSLGAYLKGFFIDHISLVSKRVLVLFMLLAFFLWSYGQKMVNGVIGYNNNNLGETFIGYFLVSVFGIFMCTLLFYFCREVKQNILFSLLKYIANNGIVILALHMFVINECDHFFYNLTELAWYPYLEACIMITIVAIGIPLFNKYLPWLIGK